MKPDDLDPARRRLLWKGGLGALAALSAGCAGAPRGDGTRFGFAGIAVDSSRDGLHVPPGYLARVIAPWGDPVGIAGRMPAWRPDAGNSAAEQALQLGMGHAGLQYHALDGSRRGLLAINHESVDEGLLQPDGAAVPSAETVAKAQAALGLSIVELAADRNDEWQPLRPSRYARRISASTPCIVSGPAAGHVLMRTAADADGRSIAGTLANRGAGRTPWGTVLSGEADWAGVFDGGIYRTADQRRYDLPATGAANWATFDRRFDARRHPNEFHRFGWIVEIDPADADAPPVKRSALGRGAHAGAAVTLSRDGRAVVYRVDGGPSEHLFKFVSRERMRPGGAKANAALLDEGMLYAARLDADGSGAWLPLQQGQGPLVPASGFADAAEVVIKARQAADMRGATKLDRPASIAVAPGSGEAFCALAGNGAPGAIGQILRWAEAGEHDDGRFRWSALQTSGNAFAAPGGLAVDGNGLLWIGTAVAAGDLRSGAMARFGNNQLLACDPATGEVRRFLTGPANCAITGASWTPDLRSLFVDVQHPGANPAGRSDPAQPTRYSAWPGGARPRSATIVVRRADGGVIAS